MTPSRWIVVVPLALLVACGESPKAAPQAPDVAVAIAVRVHRLEQETGPEIVLRSGRLEPHARVALAAESSGRITALPAAEGAVVSSDAIVASMSAAVETAERDAARTAWERIAGRNLPATERAAIAARLARANDALARRTVRAPGQGILERHLVEVGSWVRTGDVVAEFLTDGPLQVTVTLLEEEVLGIRPGTEVPFSVPAWPDRSFQARVRRIARAAREGTGSFEIELEVQANDALRAGFVATARLPLASTESRLPIPAETIRRRFGEDRVLLAEPDGTGGYRLAELTVKTRAIPGRPEWVDVSDGLTAGALVVLSGAVGLTAGDPVTISAGSAR